MSLNYQSPNAVAQMLNFMRPKNAEELFKLYYNAKNTSIISDDNNPENEKSKFQNAIGVSNKRLPLVTYIKDNYEQGYKAKPRDLQKAHKLMDMAFETLLDNPQQHPQGFSPAYTMAKYLIYFINNGDNFITNDGRLRHPLLVDYLSRLFAKANENLITEVVKYLPPDIYAKLIDILISIAPEGENSAYQSALESFDKLPQVKKMVHDIKFVVDKLAGKNIADVLKGMSDSDCERMQRGLLAAFNNQSVYIKDAFSQIHSDPFPDEQFGSGSIINKLTQQLANPGSVIAENIIEISENNLAVIAACIDDLMENYNPKEPDTQFYRDITSNLLEKIHNKNPNGLKQVLSFISPQTTEKLRHIIPKDKNSHTAFQKALLIGLNTKIVDRRNQVNFVATSHRLAQKLFTQVGFNQHFERFKAQNFKSYYQAHYDAYKLQKQNKGGNDPAVKIIEDYAIAEANRQCTKEANNVFLNTEQLP